MSWPRSCVLALGIAATCVAQDRDFLTATEVDLVREAQDPNDRLSLYIKFARQRIDLMENYLAKDKPGRSLFIRNTLEDYSKIIESIDTVTDDALRRHKPIDKGLIEVLGAEKDFLEKLNHVQDSNPRDLDRYKFLLTEAIDTTADSHESNLKDSNQRTTQLATEDSKEQKERESVMSAKELKERKKDAQATEPDPKKKVPSLYRPGEKPPDPH